MSSVTSVLLFCDASADKVALCGLNEQLFREAGYRLEDVGYLDGWGGSRRPQWDCWGAGFNYFQPERVVQLVAAAGWKAYGSVRLVVQGEHDVAPGVWAFVGDAFVPLLPVVRD